MPEPGKESKGEPEGLTFSLRRSKVDDKAKAEMISQGVMTLNEVRDQFDEAPGWSRFVLGKVVPRVVVLSLISMCWLGGYPTAAVVYSGVMIVKELGLVDRLRGNNG